MTGPLKGPNRGPARINDQVGDVRATLAGFFLADPNATSPVEQTFTARRSGLYTFMVWGGGGGGTTGAGSPSGSGAYARIARRLRAGQVVKVTPGGRGEDSKVVLPDGLVVKAEGGRGKRVSDGIAALATGGDVNKNGSIVQKSSRAGCSAPGDFDAPGGIGGDYNSRSSGGSNGSQVLGGEGGFPGGGGGNGNNTADANSAGAGGGLGAAGLVLVSQPLP